LDCFHQDDGSGKMGEKMDKEQGCSGADVLNEVVQLTGLPADYLQAEINAFLGTQCESVKDLSLDQLRKVLLNYLETLNDEMTQQSVKH
jgi:hypothetical protein